jgi:hypothetical protein
MSAIIITNPEKLREAIQFAQENKCVEQLGIGLVRLLSTLTAGMTLTNDMVAEVSGDFAPQSMRFVIWRNTKWLYEHAPTVRDNFSFNGGWIYHGPTSPGDGSAPSFSVSLEYVAGHAPTHSWSVHT